MGNQKEKYFEIIEEIVDKWKKILNVDSLWNIEICEFENDKIGGIARLDTSRSEYYSTSLEISSDMFLIDEDVFKEEIEEAVSHELIHLIMIDFFRIANILTEGDSRLNKILLYNFEQITVKLQRSFLNLEKNLFHK